MTINSSPVFKAALSNDSVTFTSADTTTKKILTGPFFYPNGLRIEDITICSDDTAAVNLAFYRFDGTTYFYIGNVLVPIGAGFTTVWAVPALRWPYLAQDNGVIDLKEGWSLACNCVATMTAGKTCTVTVAGGAVGVPALGIVQQKQNSVGGGSSSIATGNMPLQVTAGNTLHVVIASIVNAGAATHLTPTDTLGNVYAQIGSTVASTPTGASRISQWYAQNCLGGTNSVNATFTGPSPADSLGIVVIEICGTKTNPLTPAIDGYSAAFNPGDSGADVVISGSASNTKQPAIVIGVGWDIQGAINNPGTGYSAYATGWLMGGGSAKMMVEYKFLRSLGSQQATFSDNAFNIHMASMAIFDALGAA
jgi:hypothetical protein